jgi:hypothetical protein
MIHVLDAIRIVLDLAIFAVFIRTFGWMALVAPRAWWRGWAAENRADHKNPFKFGSYDYQAFEEGWNVSREVDPGRPDAQKGG